jgi:hypothetical protein
VSGTDVSPLALLAQQRSHMLFVLSNTRASSEQEFLTWYQGSYKLAVSELEGVLSVQHYEQHEVDITQGKYPPLPFRYLGLYELSVDGAEAAAGVIDRIHILHEEEAAAEEPATWLYYPVSEKVGRAPATSPSVLTLAFANATPGGEAEFREWYATRHIRHALKLPALTSGQCFERTQFQRPGAMEADFHTIAMYEQEGTPEELIAAFDSVPEGALDFPTLDLLRFAEWVYRPL